jgi:hypothetical protein
MHFNLPYPLSLRGYRYELYQYIACLENRFHLLPEEACKYSSNILTVLSALDPSTYGAVFCLGKKEESRFSKNL